MSTVESHSDAPRTRNATSIPRSGDGVAALPPPKIEVRHLNFYYGASQALKDINLDVPDKRITAVIGPSGCGKSTLLRTFNRMFDLYPEQRAEGLILLDGVDVLSMTNEISLLRRRVGMVFQKPEPFPMSIYENVAFGLRIYEQLTPAAIAERVEWALSKAALWDEVKDNLRQRGDSLSGGQQQRLCIARMIAVHPEVLLFDEPCSALDPISTARIEELIADLRKLYTVVIVTHNMQQAARCADYTAYMHHGMMLEFGDTETLFLRPKCKETEDYVTGRFG